MDIELCVHVAKHSKHGSQCPYRWLHPVMLRLCVGVLTQRTILLFPRGVYFIIITSRNLCVFTKADKFANMTPQLTPRDIYHCSFPLRFNAFRGLGVPL